MEFLQRFQLGASKRAVHTRCFVQGRFPAVLKGPILQAGYPRPANMCKNQLEITVSSGGGGTTTGIAGVDEPFYLRLWPLHHVVVK
jgi:hypothetical protein